MVAKWQREEQLKLEKIDPHLAALYSPLTSEQTPCGDCYTSGSCHEDGWAFWVTMANNKQKLRVIQIGTLLGSI